MKKLCLILILVMVLFTGCNTLDIDKESRLLTNYNINITLDYDAKTVKLSTNIDYINKEDVVLEQLFFHLYPNAFSSRELSVLPISEFNFDKAYPNGFSEGNIVISSVQIRGQNVLFSTANEESVLIVPLVQKLYPNERVIIDIVADLKIPNVKHRFGYGDNTLNLCNFYPIACVYENGAFVQDRYCYNGDPFYSEMANYRVCVSYPKDLIVGSTGECVETKLDDGTIKDVYVAKVVRDFGLVFSQKFKKLSKFVEEVTFTYLFYEDDNAEKSLQTMIDAVSTFNNLLGKYPYSTLTAVKADFIFGGMEYPNLILISNDIVNTTDYQQVIVHETGHQWFYGMVGNNEVSEAWLDEGLTEYITALFYELNPAYEIEYTDIIGEALSGYLLFIDIYEDVFGESFDTSMNRPLHAYKSEPEYTYLIYVKGMLLLDNLRNIVGDSGFILGLKNYFETNKFKVATTAHFILAISNATNKNIEGIVNSWLNGSVIIKS